MKIIISQISSFHLRWFCDTLQEMQCWPKKICYICSQDCALGTWLNVDNPGRGRLKPKQKFRLLGLFFVDVLQLDLEISSLHLHRHECTELCMSTLNPSALV